MKDASGKMPTTTSSYPRLEMRKLSELKHNIDKVRIAEPVDRYRLQLGVKAFGLLRPPIVINARTGRLLDGDQMLQALVALEYAEAPCWVVDIDEKCEETAHLALQNHVGEWQWQLVSEQLKELKEAGLDVGLTGFHDSDINPLLAADWTKPAVGPLDGSDEKQVSLL